MSKKEQILHLVDLVEQAEDEFAQRLSENERQGAGELQNWAPKEVLGHIACWTERNLDNIALARRGEPVDEHKNYLELNDQDFPRFQEMTWEQCWELQRASQERVRHLVLELCEEDLLRSDLPPSGRPVWQRITGNVVDHTMIHLSSVLNERGKPSISDHLHEAIALAQIQLAPDDAKWKAVVLYNQACQHALTGQVQKALAELAESLQLDPGLTEWSKEDTDLVSLHGDPAYAAIYQKG